MHSTLCIMYYVFSVMFRSLRILFLIALALYSTCQILNTAPSVKAQTMSNESYKIKMQGFNAISGNSSGEDYNLRSTVGNSTPMNSEGVNFKVRTGIESLESAPPFSASLSSDIIDFGILSATNPVIRTVDVEVESASTYGYSVLISENEPLSTIISDNKVFIPDTTCDNGTCSADEAAAWTNVLTYGLGYRCDNLSGQDCDNSFIQPNFYKHFPDILNNDIPQAVLSGIGSSNKKGRLSYKINISGNQAQGTYSNVITYIAVPSF